MASQGAGRESLKEDGLNIAGLAESITHPAE